MFGNIGYKTYRATSLNIDSLSKTIENISNSNSIGYKRSTDSFSEALNGEITRHESKDFSQGPLRRTAEPFDIALDGKGFFEVELPTGQRAFTRAGRFKLTSEGELVSDEGYRLIPQIEPSKLPVFGASNPQINESGEMNLKVTSAKLTVSPDLTPEIQEDGTLNGINPNTGEKTKIGKINVVVFNNTQGLESIGKSYYIQTNKSGAPLDIDTGTGGSTRVKQGFLEFGNINMAAEFMNLTLKKDLISAQLKVLKAIDKLFENVHYTIGKSA